MIAKYPFSADNVEIRQCRSQEEICMGSLKFHSGDGSKQSRLCGFGREITSHDDAG